MAIKEIEEVRKIVPSFVNMPYGQVWSTYDRKADVCYINFKKPSHADDSEITDDDIIIRYEKSKIIGLTILHASKR